MSQIRQQIIDAIKTRLQTITVANGYNTDIGKSVTDWSMMTISDETDMAQLPTLNIKDTDHDIWIEVMGNWNHEVTIEMELYVTRGQTTAAEIRKGIEDIMRAIGTDETWGGLVNYTMFDPDQSRKSVRLEIEQYKKTIARATIPMRVFYRTDYWQI